MTIRNANGKRFLDIMILVLSLMVLFLGGFFVGTQYSIILTSNQENAQIAPTNYVQNTVDPNLLVTLTNPEQKDGVSGAFVVEGKADSKVNEVVVDVFDNAGVLLYKGTVDADRGFKSNVLLSSSPTTQEGFIQITPRSEGISKKPIRTGIIFETTEVRDRVKLNAPLREQLVDDEMNLVGEFKGFFEGVVNLRIRDANNNEIFKDFITLEGDNYVNFVQFSKKLNIAELESAQTPKGVLEIYEINARDGSELIVLSLPLTLKEE